MARVLVSEDLEVELKALGDIVQFERLVCRRGRLLNELRVKGKIPFNFSEHCEQQRLEKEAAAACKALHTPKKRAKAMPDRSSKKIPRPVGRTSHRIAQLSADDVKQALFAGANDAEEG